MEKKQKKIVCARCGFMGPYYLPSVPYFALGKGFLLFICFEFEWFISCSKWIQIKKNYQLQSFITFKIYNFHFGTFSIRCCLRNLNFEFQKFKHTFRWEDDFKLKNFQLQSCSTYEDQQLLFKFFSFDIVVVILFTNLISLIYSFWNYITELSILWTNLLSLYQ